MNRKLVDGWFNAFRDKDISKLELTEDFTHTSPYGVINGRQAYLDLVKGNAEAFFSPVLEVLDVIGDGDKFAARYLVNNNPACDCFYIRNGQIAEIFSYYHVGEKPVTDF